MSIATVCAALKTILDAVTATTADGVALNINAYDPPPPNTDSVRFPAAYIVEGGAVYSYDYGADEVLETREYEIRCAIGAEATTNMATRAKHVRALLPAVIAQLLKYPNLGIAGVQEQHPNADSGEITLPDYGGVNIGFTVTIQVQELIARTYAAGE